jgi:DNA phosphorothioation-dependent restriction protein DptG
MSLRAQIDAVLAIAVATQKISKVFKHLVYANNEQDMVAFFKDPNSARIDVAFITREQTAGDDEGPDNEYDRHTISLSWYRSVSRSDDDSTNTEDGFQDDVEAVRTAFNTNRKLTVNGVHNSVWNKVMDARAVGYVTFQNVLCHYAELAVVTKDGPNATRSA